MNSPSTLNYHMMKKSDYQNEHGIDLTQDQKLADWWADTAEYYE